MIDDLETGIRRRDIFGDFEYVTALAVVYGITPLLVSAHSDSYVRLWDYFDEDNDTPLARLVGHNNAACALAVLQGPEPVVFSASYDGTIRVWDPLRAGAGGVGASLKVLRCCLCCYYYCYGCYCCCRVRLFDVYSSD